MLIIKKFNFHLADEDPSLRIESSAIINLRGVSTKLNKYIVFTMQTYRKLTINIVAGFLDTLFRIALFCVGMMIESMAGKSASMHGLVHDATPFTFSEDISAIDYFGKMLIEGKQRLNQEVSQEYRISTFNTYSTVLTI